MKTQIMTFLQSKGGAGKTTLLMLISLKMIEDGAKVAYVDTDREKNLYETLACKSAKYDYIYISDEKKIKNTIDALKKRGYDAIFFDTEGYDSAMAKYVIAESDLIFVPSKPDKRSAMGAHKTVMSILATSNEVGRKIPFYVTLIDSDRRTNISKAIKKAMMKSKIPMLNYEIPHLVGIAEMMTTVELPKGTSAKHIDGLMCELQMNNIINYYNQEEK